jgi:hypothetical protein
MCGKRNEPRSHFVRAVAMSESVGALEKSPCAVRAMSGVALVLGLYHQSLGGIWQ